MKNTSFLFFAFLLAALSGFSQESQSGGSTDETFLLTEKAFDFGKIPQGRPVTHDFVVKNTGQSPVMIERVEASCGCTSPEWSREPVLPGDSTVVKVGFNAAAEGPFSKTITILYNGNQPRTLVISGNVYHMPATSAPLNPSLSFLKQVGR